MANRTGQGPARAPRRADGLSRELIIRTAIDMLDSGGEKALTLRALTVRLRTGYGAIYHHVADKDDLLAAAADQVITGVTASTADGSSDPRTALRALALSLFDAIDAHPWVGADFSRQPWRPALLDFYESVGRLVGDLGVQHEARFDAAGALVNYVLGVAAQNAANARLLAGGAADRETFLENAAQQWAQIDPGRYPFVHAAATHLSEHDDREQFLVGVDIFLAGVATLR
ncbi:TetR family transcriptional regulator [Streptomyces caelestis]|uniref:TetR family transcriptional regulator n=2 Tax=Streptomyces TaxID=1883 RepID=A0A0M8QG50_9ACTN|nr:MULTISPECIES: TetR/AcrR family transcriptional regulator [Streptomyces]KOT34211.1 TetR family transcriptional regulator [Streptomyces caelestis]KOV36139.1 TetR family transcriptional regulator [Streptomyces sp. XY152]